MSDPGQVRGAKDRTARLSPRLDLPGLTSLELRARAAGADGAAARREMARLLDDPTLSRESRKELRAAAYRLRSQGIELPSAEEGGSRLAVTAPEPARGPSVTCVDAAASAIEGDGVALVITAWQRGEGSAWTLVTAVVRDRRGIEEMQVAELPRREAQERLAQAVSEGLAPAPGPSAALMLGGAVAAARARGEGLPRSYFRVRDWLERAVLATLPEPSPFAFAPSAWSAGLRDALFDPGRVLLWAKASASAARDPDVARWELGPALRPLREEARQRLNTRVSLLPQTRYGLLQRLAARAVQDLLAGSERPLLAWRLAYAAWRLERRTQAPDPAGARLLAASALALWPELGGARPDAGAGERVVPGIVHALVERELQSEAAPAPRAPGPEVAERRTPGGLVLPGGGPS